MPTTPAGNAYSASTTTLANGDRALVAVRDNLRGSRVPMIVYTHGNGGFYNQFYGAGEWADLRNWLIDNGWAFCESDGAGDDWGGNASRTGYEQLVAWSRTILSVGAIVVLGRSMGGLISYWLASQSNFAGDVVGLIVNSGTTDLALRYSVAAGTDLAEMNTAYGVAGTAKDIPTFTTNSAGHDPMLFSTATWAGKNVLQLGGDADTTVVWTSHGGAWWTKYGSFTAQPPSGFALKPGGDHSAANGSYHQVTEMTAFLTAVLPPDVSKTILLVRKVFLLTDAGPIPVTIRI